MSRSKLQCFAPLVLIRLGLSSDFSIRVWGLLLRARGQSFVHSITHHIMSSGISLLILFLALTAPALNASPSDDFPRFQVPGHEKQMATLRDLFWLHYPGAGPKATLWDEWLTDASLWPAITNANQSDSMRQQWSQT